jgi:uncharacterized protein
MQKDVELEHMNTNPTIYVDADACPVKTEILHCATINDFPVFFVASYKNRMNNPEGDWVYVDTDKEAADLYIINCVKKGDIVITADIGLAGTLVSKRVYALSTRGMEYRDENIASLLDQRYLSAKLRRQGKYTKGPKPFTKEDKSRFISLLTKILSNFAGKEQTNIELKNITDVKR